MASLNNTKRKNPATGKVELYWRIEWRLSGRKLGRALGFMQKREAERLFAAFLIAGEDQPPKIAPASKPSLQAWIGERYLPSVAERGAAEKTVISAKTSARNLVRLLGTLPLDGIDRAAGERYVSARKEEGAKTRTIQIELGTLTQALRLAVEAGELPELPKLRRPPNTDAKPARWLSAEESARLLAALPWETEPVSALAIYIGLELGMRSGEILSRRWEDVRWGQTQCGAIHVGSRVDAEGKATWQTKTRRARTVPLTGALLERLRAEWQRQGSPERGWLLPGRVEGNPLRTFKKGLAVACARAGLAPIHPHALRHSWATRMAIAGAPRATTQALGGWTSPRVLEAVYQHSVTELEAQALQMASVPVAAGEGSRPLRLVRGEGRWSSR